MGDKSTIEWTDATWNPVRGCSLVSPGCTNCYAMRQAHRSSGEGGAYEGLTQMSKAGPVWTGAVRVVHELMDQPLRWKKPRRIFVNSMSDLFHEKLDEVTIGSVLGIAAACPQHTFQILTKRPQRLRELLTVGSSFREAYESTQAMYIDGHYRWPPKNVWLGVSVEDQARADERIPLLLQTPAAVRWISAEPLLGRLDLANYFEQYPDHNGVRVVQNNEGIDWVVAGGESGPGARPMHPDWARSLRDQCAAAAVPFFFKQYGNYRQCETEVIPEPPPEGGRKVYPIDQDEDIGLDDERGYQVIEAHGTEFVNVGKKAAGRQLDGRTHDEYPG